MRRGLNEDAQQIADGGIDTATLWCCQEPLSGLLNGPSQGRIACATDNYFGERESACVLTSRLCLSTTRRSSRSIVLNASWITLLSGWCEPLSICLSSG